MSLTQILAKKTVFVQALLKEQLGLPILIPDDSWQVVPLGVALLAGETRQTLHM